MALDSCVELAQGSPAGVGKISSLESAQDDFERYVFDCLACTIIALQHPLRITSKDVLRDARFHPRRKIGWRLSQKGYVLRVILSGTNGPFAFDRL